MGTYCYRLLAVVVALVVVLDGIPTTLQSPVAQNYTSDILRYSKVAQLKAYMSTDKDACENFYQYACGNWQRLHPANWNVKKTAYLDQLQDLFMRKSAVMLESGHDQDNTVDTRLKHFFESCRNDGAVHQLGIEPILRVVDFKGGWPKITSHRWYEYEYDWLAVIADLRRKLGVDIFVGLEIIPDFEDRDINRIKLGAPRLHLGLKDAYWSADHEEARELYKLDIANKLHKHVSDMSYDWCVEVATQVLDVEQQLAKGLPDNPNLTVKQTTRQRYVAELKTAYGNYVDLSRYLDITLNQTMYMHIYETPEDYMSNLVEVVKQTPKLTIANYTMWRVLQHLDFAGEVNSKLNDNWCVRKIKEYFPLQLESMFHRNYNHIQMINDLQSVWADIKKAFRDELLTSTKLNWITLNTRQKAVQKLEAIKLNIVAPDDEELAAQMSGLHIGGDTYFSNLVNVLEWQTKRKFAQLNEKPQEPEPEMRLPQFQHTKNSIDIPTTFLQSHFFGDPEYPSALKYSTLGFLLAHEMLHAFDAVGRRYDQHGYQRSWWDSNSEFAYDQYAKCFADNHYSNYVFRGEKLSNAAAHSESILDNGGLEIAYRAYEKWSENLEDRESIIRKESLPLFEYTPKQIFFIGFAQLWCADYYEDFKQYTELPEPLRVNGALAHSNDFARDFQCDKNSKMSPAHKCVIY